MKKIIVTTCAGMLLFSGKAVAEDQIEEISNPGSEYASLIEAIKTGEKRGHQKFSEITENREQYIPKEQNTDNLTTETLTTETSSFPSFYNKRPKSSQEQILELVEEVKNLRAKEVSDKTKSLSIDSIGEGKNVGTKTYYSFSEGKIYEVYAGVDRVTEIELQESEDLTGTPVAGDTVRWKIGVISSGAGSNKKTHLILKPLEEGIETNILIPTTKRIYHLRAISGNWYMPGVAWNYPDEVEEDLKSHIKREDQLEPAGLTPESLSFSYRVEGENYSWKPLRVFDDGKKTYFQMPEAMSATEAPVLFVIDEHNEPALVNYRVKGTYYIIDRIIYRAQMRVGKNGIVDIYSSRYRKSFWDRLF